MVAADILALTLLKPPGEFGADVVVGNTQRFGVPLGFGGPHAGYMATRDAHKRHLPGRLVGVSHDAEGRPGYRLALQTREQHIRRDKATSNICTAQVLLAVMASMYAVYHGPRGLRAIAQRTHDFAAKLAAGLTNLGFEIAHEEFFDTLRVELGAASSADLLRQAERAGCNLRALGDHSVGIALDETTSEAEIETLMSIFRGTHVRDFSDDALDGSSFRIPQSAVRTSEFLTHPIFNTHDTETEMLRYLRRLEARDLSLTHSMIPLGSCTMKLNASAEMFPVSWPEFSRLHPFAPEAQTTGYRDMCEQLEHWLAEITGFAAVSLQPNAGSQGEYAGLLAIREYHRAQGQGARKICLIPNSAHGTNPASAVMAGFKVVPIATLKDGDIDLADLRAKADAHKDDLAALMVTYPSTHGVFETTIREICEIVHSHGGQVYMDGANMNAQVGLCRPGDIGADVCHLNLHKTFCIPHGGGGPGMGPIGVAGHLIEFLPSHPKIENPNLDRQKGVGPVSAAPFGSASILTISWMYIRMMGGVGLTDATRVAILNANYIAKRLGDYYPVLYRGRRGLVAHECIVDLRQFKSAGVEVEDVAKRLMDYGFHAPTVSFPVAGTMMIEPTESEAKPELDRFCDAMIAIHAEIQEVVSGKADKQNNVLKNAPHTARQVTADKWDRPYSRERAAYPADWLRDAKFWPAVARIDNVYGDRNLFCSCVADGRLAGVTTKRAAPPKRRRLADAANGRYGTTVPAADFTIPTSLELIEPSTVRSARKLFAPTGLMPESALTCPMSVALTTLFPFMSPNNTSIGTSRLGRVWPKASCTLLKLTMMDRALGTPLRSIVIVLPENAGAPLTLPALTLARAGGDDVVERDHDLVLAVGAPLRHSTPGCAGQRQRHIEVARGSVRLARDRADRLRAHRSKAL